MAISKVILNGVTQMDVTGKSVTADSMLPGVTALKNDGTDITGNLPTQAAQTIHPSTADQTIASGKYLTGAQTIKAVTTANLTAENIKSGVTVKVGDSTDDDCVASVTGTLAQTTYTATIVESYYNSGRFYVRPPYSTRPYYTTGDTFTFGAGWVLYFGSMDSMGLYVDGELYGTGTSVHYTAPAHDINIVLGQTQNDVIFPTISIAANGTYNVEDYCKAEVNVPSDDFVITLTKNASTGVWEPDCTYAEMYAAYTGGKTVAVVADDTPCEISIIDDPAFRCDYSVMESNYDTATGTDSILSRSFHWTSSGITESTGDPAYYTYDATAVPGDVASGKVFYNSAGRQVGTATGASLQAKTNISPTTSSQTITADSGYDGLASVQINAMPTGTAGTPTATKGTVSNHSVTVTPSVTNSTGYITGGTKTGTGRTYTESSEMVGADEESDSDYAEAGRIMMGVSE